MKISELTTIIQMSGGEHQWFLPFFIKSIFSATATTVSGEQLRGAGLIISAPWTALSTLLYVALSGLKKKKTPNSVIGNNHCKGNWRTSPYYLLSQWDTCKSHIQTVSGLKT